MRNQRLDGIACLYVLKDKTKKLEKYPDLHINIWEASSNKRSDHSKFPFLDIGLMIHQDTYKEVESIFFVFPGEITRKNIEDLSSLLNKNEAINAIFNEVACVTDKNSNFIVKDMIKKDNNFLIMNLNEENLIVSQNKSNGKTETRIELKIEHLIKSKEQICKEDGDISKIYVRFRIKSISSNIYKLEFQPKDNFLQSSWKKEQIIDFRFNVKRGLSLDIIGGNNDLHMMKFNKIHLFLMKKINDEIKFEDKNFKSCRSLENEFFWNNYIKIKDKKSKNESYISSCLGYQWSAKKENGDWIEEFSVLARFQKTEFTIIRYLFLTLLAGMSGGLISNIAGHVFQKFS